MIGDIWTAERILHREKDALGLIHISSLKDVARLEIGAVIYVTLRN